MAVNITDILRPKYDTDTYALLEDIYLQGGFRVVSNTTEMNSITEQRKNIKHQKKNGFLKKIHMKR